MSINLVLQRQRQIEAHQARVAEATRLKAAVAAPVASEPAPPAPDTQPVAPEVQFAMVASAPETPAALEATDPAMLSDDELLAAWRKICTVPELSATWPPEQRARAINLARADTPYIGDTIKRAERGQAALDAAAKRTSGNGGGLVVSGTDGAAVYSLTEDNLARVFADQFRDRLRFSHGNGRWYVWDGTRWREETTDRAFHFTRELCRQLNTDGKRQWAKAAVAAAVERFARADPVFAMRGDEWNANAWLLGTPAGTVDLKTGELRAANPDDLITHSTAVAPEEGEPRLWRQFLSQATQGDEELELFLRQLFGYALTGDTREECLFYFYGSGGNGKGTFVGAMFDILADYAKPATMDTFLASKFDRHSTDLAMLRDARLVIASETSKGRAWDEQRVKTLTGGDAITARFMRMDNFSYKPAFKLVLFGNHKPTLRTVDDAWRRRFHVVPFTYRPPKQDATLKERLRTEYPQILRWAIDGCVDWQKNGLVVPARVKAETAEYFATQDQFQTWLDEYCDTDRRYVEINAVLFAAWKRFCEQIGEQPGTSRTLADELATHGFRRIKNELGIRGRGFAGLKVKP